MKHFLTGMLLALALVAALVVGMAAVAENAAPEMPALEAAQPDQAQPDQAQPEQAQPDQGAQQDDAALRQAYDAYRAARQSSRQEALEDELKGYVEAGKLTQEQADLILKDSKERESLRNGTCPDCGYQFKNGMGKGGRMNGMNGGMGRGKGGRMNGGRGMFNGQQQAACRCSRARRPKAPPSCRRCSSRSSRTASRASETLPISVRHPSGGAFFHWKKG